jgi:hypothetical protein
VTRVAVAPKKYAPGFEEGQEWAPTVYVVRELREALEHVYFTDAHLVTYLVEGLEKQPRVNKAGLALYGKRLTVECFFCDVDNPGHAPWTEAWFEAARAQDRTLPTLATAGVYYTRGGRRIVQPLAEPLEIDVVEAHMHQWMAALERDGLAVDWDCKDWTRHYRVPNAHRDADRRSRCIDLARMRPIALPPLPPPSPEPAPTTRRTRRRGAGTPLGPWTNTLPEPWRPIAETIAPAVAQVQTEWHSLFLALAGALVSRRVPPEHVPALCHAISVLTGRDDRTDDRVASARTTVERHRAGLRTRGYATLRDEWPNVADALDVALARGSERRLRDAVAAPTGVPAAPLAAVTTDLEEAIRRPRDGLTLIQAGCGLGKTRAAEKIAAERAAKPYATSYASGARAPPQSKTSISVDKHALVRQIVRHLDVLGAPAGWHHGPLAKLDDDGKPVCKLADVATPLVAGGQPMQWVLCRGRDVQRCEHYDSCTAKDGYEGPDNPRVHVGPHALLGALDGAAGTTGLLVVDEPPPLLETLSFTPADFASAFAMLDAFDGAYAAAMRPALEAVGAWLASGPVAAPATTIEGVVATYASVVDAAVLAQAGRSSGCPGADAVACARAAPLPDDGPPAPPLRWPHLAVAKKNASHAKRIGEASRLLGAIHHALTSKAPVAARLEARGRRRLMHLTRVREHFSEALRREGSVVVLDANVELWAPVYEKVVGYAPPVLRFAAQDGAPVERTLHRLAAATRTAWLSDGKLRIAPSLRTAIRTAIAWANERPGNGLLALIAMHVVELAVRGAHAPDDRSIDEAWLRAGQDPATLERAREELGPLLREWRGELLLGHYGALRGLDAMADADNLVTLGDPWPNLDQVRHECAYLGLGDWEPRLEAMCRAELEQAHGRLRTVHRTRPARALHVGTVLPAGPGWGDGAVVVRRSEPGRPRAAGAMEPAEFVDALERAGGIKPLAKLLGVARNTVRAYRDGASPIPPDVAAALRTSTGKNAPRSAEGGSSNPLVKEEILNKGIT